MNHQPQLPNQNCLNVICHLGVGNVVMISSFPTQDCGMTFHLFWIPLCPLTKCYSCHQTGLGVFLLKLCIMFYILSLLWIYWPSRASKSYQNKKAWHNPTITKSILCMEKSGMNLCSPFPLFLKNNQKTLPGWHLKVN